MIHNTLEQVLSYYDLGEFKAARQPERGFVNDNWIVETDQGPCFLKRRHPHLRHPNLIRAQHALVEHLRRGGFPAPAVVPTRSGETCLALDGEFYEAHEYIEGQAYNPSRPAHMEEAALVLSDYHTCVQGFAPQALSALDALYSPAIVSTALASLAETWELYEQLETHALDLAARFAGHGALPYLVIHGDYYAGNLLFEGDRIIGVVDYDKANWQPRVVELAEALIYFASPRPGHMSYLVYSGFLDWELFTCFLQSYARAVTLTESERQALPDYVRCIWLLVSLERLREKGSRPAYALEALQELLALADWAKANADRMIKV